MRNTSVTARVVGLLEGLLVLRLVALLFAARPDNPATAALIAVTMPLIAPFGVLDRIAGQPRFGARLELATIAAMLGVALLALLIQRFMSRASRPLVDEDHHAQSQRPDRQADR